MIEIISVCTDESDTEVNYLPFDSSREEATASMFRNNLDSKPSLLIMSSNRSSPMEFRAQLLDSYFGQSLATRISLEIAIIEVLILRETRHFQNVIFISSGSNFHEMFNAIVGRMVADNRERIARGEISRGRFEKEIKIG